MKKFTAMMLLGGSLLSASAPAYAAFTVEPQPSAKAATVHQPIETAGYWAYAQCVAENRAEAINYGLGWHTFLTPVMIGMALACM